MDLKKKWIRYLYFISGIIMQINKQVPEQIKK